MSIVSGTIAAFKGADAIQGAADTNAGAQTAIYNDTKERFAPYEAAGKAALPGLTGWDAANPLPSFEDTVNKPMEGWDYKQSPAYEAKYTLGMEELNKQLQARGLAPSGVGATRAADLSRRLTSEDYAGERTYKRGTLTDLYKSRYSENTDRYNRLLDQVKMGQGAAGSMGQAGNQYAQGVGQAAMQAGEAKAGFYSGLGGLTGNAASTGLKAYDYGNKQGWWGQGANSAGVTAAGADAAATAYAPGMAADYGALYGL
jgi:hypothetical protein